jgi:hypothetical protein
VPCARLAAVSDRVDAVVVFAEVRLPPREIAGFVVSTVRCPTLVPPR